LWINHYFDNMTKSFSFHKLGLFLSLLMVVGLVSCGGKKSDEDSDGDGDKGAAATTGAAATVDMANGATINGTVKVDGATPAVKSVKMDADPACKAAHSTPVDDNHWIVKDGAVSDAFVYIKDGLNGKVYAAPATAVKLEQKGCEYTPHVFGVMVGQTLQIVNDDATLHNVHAHGEKNDQFNMGQPQGTPAKEIKLDKMEVMVPIKCDVHGWMNSFAGVLPHPFFSVTDASGKYEIKGVPAGDYTIEAWHETTKMDGKGVTSDQKVTVAAKDTKTVDFTLKAE
jgi:plastocyanin